jgi:hypothetical protein
VSLNAQTPQFSGYPQQNPPYSGPGSATNLPGPGQFSGQSQQFSPTKYGQSTGPSVNVGLSGPGQYSGQTHFESSPPQNKYNTQVGIGGSSHNQFSGPTSYPNNSHFEGPGLHGNIGVQGPEVNVSLSGGQGNSGYGYEQQQNIANFDNNLELPTSPEQIRKFITVRPFTQTLDNEDLTYSIIPKKQQSFVMTHERFLLLKGIEILGYARELPEKQPLPFGSLAEVPAPKTVVQLSAIEKVEVEGEKLIVRHSDKEKTVWEFLCPTKRCAVEWNQKIREAIDGWREFQQGNFQSVADYYRFKKGVHATSTFHHHAPSYDSPRRELPRLDPTPTFSQPQLQAHNSFKGGHDDEASRSVYDNSGLRSSPTKFGINVNSTIDNQYSSPVKPGQYEVGYQSQSPPQNVGLNFNANYQGGSFGGSTQGSIGGRSYTVSSNSSLGRYPMGMPIGQPQQPYVSRSNMQN